VLGIWFRRSLGRWSKVDGYPFVKYIEIGKTFRTVMNGSRLPHIDGCPHLPTYVIMRPEISKWTKNHISIF
jgi:hypothetical protein